MKTRTKRPRWSMWSLCAVLVACSSEDMPASSPGDMLSDMPGDSSGGAMAGGAGDDVAVSDQLPVSTIVPVQDGSVQDGSVQDGPSLLEALQTRHVSAEDFDAWLCSSDLTDIPVAYLFPSTASNSYVVIDATQGFEAEFLASLLDTAGQADSVSLEYPATGTIEILEGLHFDGEDSWAASSSTDGRLNCERKVIRLPGT